MIPLRLQSHKTQLLPLADQQALEYQVPHFSVSAWGLDHSLHIQPGHIAEDIYPVHLLIPTDSM